MRRPSPVRSAEQFFEQVAGWAEEALEGFEGGAGVVDQFDRLVERDVLDRRSQRGGDQRAERVGIFGILDRAQQTGTDRLRELLGADVVLLAEALASLFGRQRLRQRLAADAEFAGGAVERRERELLRDLLQRAGVGPGAVHAGVTRLVRRIGGTAGGEVGADEDDRGEDRAADQELRAEVGVRAHRSTLRERPIGISASRPIRAARPKEGLNAWVAPRSSWSCSSSRRVSTWARSSGSSGSGLKAGPIVGTLPFS